jgi:hypothetical protein
MASGSQSIQLGEERVGLPAIVRLWRTQARRAGMRVNMKELKSLLPPPLDTLLTKA